MSANATGNCSSDTITATGPTVVQGIPTGWSLSLYNVTWGADTLGVSLGIVTNPDGDGYDAFDIVLQGKNADNQPLLTLGNALMSTTSQLQTTIGATDSHRALCKVQFFPGPNGHLWGIDDDEIRIGDVTTGVFTAPGMTGVTLSPTNTYKSYAAVFGYTEFEFNDGDIFAGPETIAELTPPTNVGEPSAMTVAPTVSVQAITSGSDNSAGGPVSAVVRLKQCWAGKVTQ